MAEEVIQSRLFDSGFEDQAELGLLSSDQVLVAVQKALDHRVPLEALVYAWASAFEPDPGIMDCIKSLPVRSVIFTNNGPMLDACLSGPLKGLATVVSEIICSWHVRARKPDAVAYGRVAERLKCSSERLLLLDDNIENVKGALSCGWDAACVSSVDEVIAALSLRSGLRHAPL